MDISRLAAPVLYELFQFFNINERAALEETHANWDRVLEFINEMTTSLCFYSGNYSFGKRWTNGSSTGRLIGYQNSFDIQNMALLLKQPNRICFENIQRLCLIGSDSIRALGEHFKRFTSLQHLEIDQSSSFGSLFDHELPVLKVLAVKNFSFARYCRINAPSLQALVWYPITSTNITFASFDPPVQLRHLECSSYPPRCDHIQLDRLETLTCERIEGSISLDELPALQQLQVGESVDGALVKRLQTERFQLGRNNSLNLVFLDLYPSTFINPLSYYPINCYFLRAEHIQKKLDVLSKSSLSIPHRLSLYYNGFQEQFGDDQDGQMQALLKKLTNVHKVEVFDKQDPNRVIKFLHRCGAFKMLDLYYCAFDNSFYDQLERFKSITHLKIKEQTDWQIHSYDFLKGFSDLRSIFVHYDGLAFDIDHIFAFLRAAFKHCSHLKQFAFGRKYFRCTIKRQIHPGSFYLCIMPATEIDLPAHYANLDRLLADLSAEKQELKRSVLIPLRFQTQPDELN